MAEVPLIAIDLDGVIVDFVHMITTYGQKEYSNQPYSTGGQTDWFNWSGLSDDQFNTIMRKANYLPNFWEKAPSLLGEGETSDLASFMKLNKGVIITNRKHTLAAQTERWLERRGLNIWEIAYTDNKAEAVAELDVGLVLEDNPENVVNIANNTNAMIFIRDWPYNRKPYLNELATRVSSVSEFIRYARFTWVSLKR